MAKLNILSVVVLSIAIYSVQSQEPNCPPDESQPIFFPDPLDCSMYYMCSDGVAHHLSCPPPLVWDQSVKACNHPGIVQCRPSTTTTTTQRTTTTTRPPTTTTTGTTTTTAPPTTTTTRAPRYDI